MSHSAMALRRPPRSVSSYRGSANPGLARLPFAAHGLLTFEYTEVIPL